LSSPWKSWVFLFLQTNIQFISLYAVGLTHISGRWIQFYKFAGQRNGISCQLRADIFLRLHSSDGDQIKGTKHIINMELN
jgi:hypothetical protein